jgi:hypothetical protein
MYFLTRVFCNVSDLTEAWQRGTDQDRDFIQQLALFFTSLFKTHLTALEQNTQLHPFIIAGHFYLVSISLIPDVELFKIVLEYWNTLVCSSELFFINNKFKFSDIINFHSLSKLFSSFCVEGVSVIL